MITMRALTKKEQQELITMYQNAVKDFEYFPFVQTTEDLFRWREKVKEENGNDGNRRNEIIEAAIRVMHL